MVLAANSTGKWICIIGNEIIAEIKQIDMNPEEKQEYDKFKEGGLAAGSNTIGKRVGKKITDANQQLSKLTRGKLPSICIMYDNTPLGYHTDPNNIRFGMYGLPAAIIAKSTDRSFKSSILDWKFGKNRKMTRNANTNTSVVAAMFREIDDPEHPPYLVAYHNVYAKIELKSEIQELDNYPIKKPIKSDKKEGKNDLESIFQCIVNIC